MVPPGLSVMQSRTNQNVHTAQSSKRKRLIDGVKGGAGVSHQNADLKIEDGEDIFAPPNQSYGKLPSTSHGKRRVEARIQSFNFKIKGVEPS